MINQTIEIDFEQLLRTLENVRRSTACRRGIKKEPLLREMDEAIEMIKRQLKLSKITGGQTNE